MIFVGDVAIAHHDQIEFCGFNDLPRAKPWCLNLEGPVVDQGNTQPSWGVYNTGEWWSSFSHFQLGPVFIGNNHIHDISGGIRLTLENLNRRGVIGFGAGMNADQAAHGALVRSGKRDYSLLGFGWTVIGCKPANGFTAGVNRLEACAVLAMAERAVQKIGSGRVVVVIHGNYEFERYPQPAHRKLAMMLIDRGVYAVVCHHPHVVSPVERYDGRTIAYSLGNWAFSYGRFFGGKLRFPPTSFHQIALELAEGGDIVHHAIFKPPSTVRYQEAEPVDSDMFSLRPVFEGFSQSEYVRWFKANRVKRKGLPVYLNAADSPGNWARDSWVRFRQVLIDSAAKTGLKVMRRVG